MNGLLVIVAFIALFVLGFPVVLAIGIPCVVYLLANGLPLDLIAQRTLYALIPSRWWQCRCSCLSAA